MSDNLPDLSGVPQGLSADLSRLLRGLRDHVRRLSGLSGDGSEAALTVGKAATLLAQASSSSSGSGSSADPDLTPPPTPTGVSVTAGLTYVFIETDDPEFTSGHGYDRTVVFGAKWPTGGTEPTFASAVEVATFIGSVGSFATDTGTRWCIWLKWRSNDGVESTSPEGGTNGHVVTTGLVGNADLGPLIVQAGNLAAGAVTAVSFDASIEPITLVTGGSLPTTKSTSTIFYAGKVYRWNGTAYVSTVPTSDLTGQITSTQITDGSITTPKIFSGSITADKIASHAITANEIAAGTITANELAAASVTAAKIAANAIAVGTAAIQNGAIVNAMIGSAAIDDAKIANVSASKITAGSIAVGDYIQSVGFTSGSAGWRIGGNGVAEFNSVTIRGATYTGTIYASAGTIGGITIASGYLRAGQIGFDNGSGFYLGSDGRFSLGNSLGNKLTWDGTTLNVVGGGTFSGSLAAATVDTGGLTVSSTGFIQGGQTAYNTGNGFWLGYDSSTYKFSVKGSSGQGMTFDGTNLLITGAFTASAINAVDTINIKDNAVTIPLSATWSGSFFDSSGAAQIVATASADFAGQPVTITATVFIGYTSDTGSISGAVRIFRDGSALAVSDYVSVNGSSVCVTYSIKDTPPSGSHNYGVGYARLGIESITRASIVVLGVKK